jgi:transcriptional regulator with XRE-family HTH domain
MIETPPNRLKELRQAKGLSRRDLAVGIDVTEDRIRQLEKPEAGIPTQHAPTLAAILGVDPAHLMGWDRLPVAGGAA